MKTFLRKMAGRLQRFPPFVILLLALVYLLIFSILDHFRPPGMSFTLLYVFGIAFVGWGAGMRHALFVSVACVAMDSLEDWFWPRNHYSPGVMIWNAVARLGIFAAVGWLAAEATRLTQNLGRLVDERTARWRAEAEQHQATSHRLEETVERLDQLASNITEVFWLSDVSKKQIIYVSPGYERIWGRKCADLYVDPHSWNKAIHSSQREEILRRAVEDQLQGKYDVEYRILRPDGTERWIRDRAFPVRNRAGEVYRIAGIAEDITEQKRSEHVQHILLALGEKLNAVSTPIEAARAILGSADELWRWDSATISMYYPETDQMQSVLSFDIVDGRRQETDLSAPKWTPSSRARRTMQHGAELLKADPATPLPSDARMFGDTARRSACIISVPFRREGRSVGVISIQSYSPDAFTLEDLKILRLLGEYCGGTLERIRVAAALRESDERYRAVVEDQSEIISRFSADGRLTFVNGAFWRFFDCVGQDVLGHPWQSRAHADDLPMLEERLREISPMQPYVAVENRVYNGDGDIRWMQFVNRGMFDNQGRLLEIQSVGRDITEQKQVEIALRESGERLRALITALPATLFACDSQGIITFEDGRALTGLEGGPADRIGRSVFDLFVENPVLIENARRVLGGEEFSSVVEIGNEAIECWYSPTRDEGGRLNGYVGVALNVSERLRLEKQILEISDQQQVRIGQDIHDDLSQLLVGLALDANSLEQKLARQSSPEAGTAGRIAHYLDHALTSARALSRGLFPVPLEREGLPSALEQLAAGTAERTGLECSFEADGTVALPDTTLAMHLYRIAQEAVNNAVKHAKSKQIAIHLAADETDLELSVEDNGVGLDLAHSGPSDGMGLRIMAYRARAIGGILRVEPGRRGGTRISCQIAHLLPSRGVRDV